VDSSHFGDETLESAEGWEFLECLKDSLLLRNDFASWS
jgi:hypothetical protein